MADRHICQINIQSVKSASRQKYSYEFKITASREINKFGSHLKNWQCIDAPGSQYFSILDPGASSDISVLFCRSFL